MPSGANINHRLPAAFGRDRIISTIAGRTHAPVVGGGHSIRWFAATVMPTTAHAIKGGRSMLNRLTIKCVFYVSLSLIWLLGPAGVAAQNSLLDGRSYIGQSEEKHKKKVTEDELSFRNGKLHSSGFDQRGFAEGDYTAIAIDEEIFFEAKTMSPKHGDIEWSGVVIGDTIQVDYLWLKRGWLTDTEKVYSFKGTLKK
jgi:hypothetical protein